MAWKNITRAQIVLIISLGVLILGGLGGWYMYNDAQKREAVSDYFEAMAKHGCEVKALTFSGDEISGKVAFQNGFGAWSTYAYSGSIKNDNGKWALSVHIPVLEQEQAKAEREQLEARKQRLDKIIEEIDASHEKAKRQLGNY